MPKVPEFLLRALYVQGSLHGGSQGFSFQMKNEMGPARIIGARPLQIDRKPVDPAKCRFIHGEIRATFADVSPENSVLMRKGEAVTVMVEGVRLRRGRHTLRIDVEVKDMGPVAFSVNDTST
jgi:hypothetical protein